MRLRYWDEPYTFTFIHLHLLHLSPYTFTFLLPWPFLIRSENLPVNYTKKLRFFARNFGEKLKFVTPEFGTADFFRIPELELNPWPSAFSVLGFYFLFSGRKFVTIRKALPEGLSRREFWWILVNSCEFSWEIGDNSTEFSELHKSPSNSTKFNWILSRLEWPWRYYTVQKMSTLEKRHCEIKKGKPKAAFVVAFLPLFMRNFSYILFYQSYPIKKHHPKLAISRFCRHMLGLILPYGDFVLC